MRIELLDHFGPHMGAPWPNQVTPLNKTWGSMLAQSGVKKLLRHQSGKNTTQAPGNLAHAEIGMRDLFSGEGWVRAPLGTSAGGSKVKLGFDLLSNPCTRPPAQPMAHIA